MIGIRRNRQMDKGRSPMNNTLSRIARVVTPVISTAVALATIQATAASADTADNQFLWMVNRDHVTAGSNDNMFSMAHETCDAFGLPRAGLGINPFSAAIMHVRDELGGAGLAPSQATMFMRDAVAAYCPQFN